MGRLRSILGTLWALAAVPLLLVMFMGFGRWPTMLVAATGLEVSPWYTGGAVVSSAAREGYEVRVHRPVFDGLIGQRSQGLVQVDFVPGEGSALPAEIRETVTPSGNTALAFEVRLDTATHNATIAPGGPNVTGLQAVHSLKQGLAVRVGLRNPR